MQNGKFHMNLLSSMKNWGKDSLVKFGKEISYQRKDQELWPLRCYVVRNVFVLFYLFLWSTSWGNLVLRSLFCTIIIASAVLGSLLTSCFLRAHRFLPTRNVDTLVEVLNKSFVYHESCNNCEELTANNFHNVDGASLKDRKSLIDELEFMKTMSPHPNIVGLVGCCTRTGLFI